MGIVYSKQAAYVSWSAGQAFIKQDEAWDSEADLVRERPDLFADEPTKVAGRRHAAGPVVERATRAPGEVRETPARKPKGTAQ